MRFGRGNLFSSLSAHPDQSRISPHHQTHCFHLWCDTGFLSASENIYRSSSVDDTGSPDRRCIYPEAQKSIPSFRSSSVHDVWIRRPSADQQDGLNPGMLIATSSPAANAVHHMRSLTQRRPSTNSHWQMMDSSEGDDTAITEGRPLAFAVRPSAKI
ncbi:hypothetical protein BD324DRAFT_637421 [Kockovaella imperatae]|uniref:Uncharacterized protein n=1 Tax=Kockovaella imperatae TaxID=4999 RepID=A0A1Y1U8F2_9TREE|nr:hypothetical protein BD324DRAFT_637421 [Kockovaella imperatae]ORX34292.1 hypothetical protein BD324DRAFT_637421 [Kockovaella imperatae]